MKRTPLARGTKPLKRSPFKRPATSHKIAQVKSKAKKVSVASLKEKLWLECKRITRKRFPNICYTCGATGLEKHNWQTGHGKAKGALPLRFKFDIRNLRPQCYHCNHEGNGMTDIFIAKLEQEPEGFAFLEEACYFDEIIGQWRIRQDIPSLGGIEATIFIENLLKQYKTMYL